MSDPRNTRVRDTGTRGKPLAAALSATVLAVVTSPIRENWKARGTRRDGFPLSYYPMFTAKRRATGKVTHLVGLTADGATRNLPHRLAGSGGLNQVRRQLTRSTRRGHAAEVCTAVAAKVIASGDPRHADLVEVRMVTGEYRFADFYAGRLEPLRERIHASVAVAR